MKKNNLLIPLTIALLTACASQKTIMDSWLGKTKQQLIMGWGPPERTASDGGAGEILVYSSQIYIPPSTFYGGNGSSTTTRSVTFWDYKFFYVDGNNKIYYWMTQRQQVPPIQIDLNVYKRY